MKSIGCAVFTQHQFMSSNKKRFKAHKTVFYLNTIKLCFLPLFHFLQTLWYQLQPYY